MAIEQPNNTRAMALVEVDAVAGTATFAQNRGFASVVRNGVGDYTLTLDDEMTFARNPFAANPITDAANVSARQLAAPNEIGILIGIGAAAADSSFKIAVLQMQF